MIKHNTIKHNTQNTKNHPFWQIIRTIDNFPKPGIEFYDITPLLQHHVTDVTDALLTCLPNGLFHDIDCLIGVESRGFLFASLLSGRTGKGMTVARKAGKLPPPVVREDYALEYGTDSLEILKNTDPAIRKVLIVDDILATGGTLKATAKLCQSAGYDVVGALVLIDLVDLHKDLGLPVFSVLQA
ncbi:adenine phosphoribosyltransferase [Moraxella macacae 0408225]|uniref:adenine phosphoribosyltransferase n=1 Tax=Moraxella macacae 0408225 TaxID=1230338 RepID=L2F6X9_9GAMM|nr:adenine phosphoribosyltransferase [Moraxella macacae]ELA08645.1 adenine phosphoribosyltransferase [Moraxella macacae 0408225]